MPNLVFYSQTQHVYYTGLLSRSDFMVNVSFTKAFRVCPLGNWPLKNSFKIPLWILLELNTATKQIRVQLLCL